MDKVETLASAKQKLRDALAFERFLMERWPEGSEIRWMKREYEQVGEAVNALALAFYVGCAYLVWVFVYCAWSS